MARKDNENDRVIISPVNEGWSLKTPESWEKITFKLKKFNETHYLIRSQFSQTNLYLYVVP